MVDMVKARSLYGGAFLRAWVQRILFKCAVHAATRKEEEEKLMTRVQNPTVGGSAGVSAAAKDNGGAVECSPDGSLPTLVVDAGGVGDEVRSLDPQVLALCYSPGSVDFAAVSALNDAQKATLMESLTSARDEARARARLAYAALVAARKPEGEDDAVVEQCRMDYESKVRNVGSYVDALALVKTLDILEKQGFPTRFNRVDDVIVKTASLLDEGVIDLSDEIDSITDIVLFFHNPQMKTGFAEIMNMRAHGDNVSSGRLVQSLQQAGEAEDRNPMFMTLCLFHACNSYGIAKRSDHRRRFYDVDFVAALFEGNVPQDDVNEFIDMLISGVRGVALSLYKDAFWDAYREAFRAALKESTGQDHTGVIKVDRWEGDSEQRLKDRFERMSAFFPRFLHDKRNKQRDALTVVYNELKYGEGVNSYWADGMKFIKPVVRRAIVGVVDKHDVLTAAPLDDSRFNMFIDDDGVFDDTTFIAYLGSLGDDSAAGVEGEKVKARYEKFFPVATVENLETVRDLVTRHEQCPGSVGNLTSRSGEHYSIIMDTFTGFDGKERIRVRSAVPVDLGDMEMDNACVIGVGLDDDDTVIHEMSHDMEREPQIHQVCLAFLDRRTAGAEPIQARAVDDYLVLPGDFYSHYVGRTYEQPGDDQQVHTEVLPSGMDAIIPMRCVSYYDQYKDGKLLPIEFLVDSQERDIVKRIRATLTKDGGVQVIDVPPSTRYDDEHRNLVLGILSAIYADAPTTVEEARTYIRKHGEHLDGKDV